MTAINCGKENSLLAGRNLQQNQAQGGAAICCDRLGVKLQ